jgi:glycosyltransferase involved in cell wall biosynthesis
MASTLRGLRACGEVDMFSIVSNSRTDLAAPPKGDAPDRWTVAAIDDAAPGAVRFAESLARVDLPFEIPWRNQSAITTALDRFVSGPYDLVWFFRVRAWVLGRAVSVRRGDGEPAPMVVDLDDLEDQKILARRAIPPEARADATPVAAKRARRGSVVARVSNVARAAGSRLMWAEEVRRWRSLHRRIADRAAAVVVCSDLDAGRIALPRTQVVPNSYPDPGVPERRPHPSGAPPVVLFQGTLRYPPNADGARFLVDDVAPLLRRQVPDVQIRLVGLASPAVSALHDPPRVVVTGQVPDIAVELAGADVVVVPLRFGSGTRVKNLEAFAHRVPVVSTTLGAEGLHAEPGVHLLTADSAAGLAAACAHLLRDPCRREAMAALAYGHYREHGRSDLADAAVMTVARDAIAACR